ncbi:MAG TPA: hypothetical protein PLE00_05580, partial [Anaerolineaceae bacterium]|nr:hypothetical protein [Anaerolineaceae bacterium]
MINKWLVTPAIFSVDMVDRYDHPVFVHSHFPLFRIEGKRGRRFFLNILLMRISLLDSYKRG